MIAIKRKVVKHGPSTFIISLPAAWIKKYGVSKGDELDVEEEGNAVRISTVKEKQLGHIQVDVTDLDRSSLMYLIRSLYKLGYDEIRLDFKKQTTFHHRLEKQRTVISVIHEEVNRLTGIEVMQQRQDFCVLRAFSEMSFSEFDTILRRIFLLLIDASNDMIKGAKEKDEALLLTVEQKHNTITKFLSFCMRLLNKKGYADHRKALIVYSILVMLDKELDVIKNSARLLKNLKPTISPKTYKLIKRIHESIVHFYELYYKFDNAKVLLISEIRDNILKEIQEGVGDFSKKEIMALDIMAPTLELIISMTESRLAMEY